MKIGIPITDFSNIPTAELGPQVSRTARAADEAGFDSIWTMDHFFQIPMSGRPRESPMLEVYATLAFIAGQTRRIRLGTMVTAVVYRHPGALVKAVTSLDVLSGGRTIFGVGAAWDQEEAEALGIPFPPLGERFERLEELLQVAHQMWRGDESPFQGRHYQLGRPLNSPNSLQRPHPPILVGGGGERRTLKLVARYADACNLFAAPGNEADLEHKLDVLRRHCEAEGRDQGEIEKTAATFFELGDNPREWALRLPDYLEGLARLGIEHVVLGIRRPWSAEDVEAVAEVLPEIQALGR